MRLVGQILRRLFPAYFRRKEEKETAEMWELVREQFSEDRLKTVFPFFRIRRKGDGEKWRIRVDSRTDIGLLFNILPCYRKPIVRYTSERVFYSVKVDRKNSLILEEYRNPYAKHWTLDGEEVLIARAIWCRGHLSCEIINFYRI